MWRRWVESGRFFDGPTLAILAFGLALQLPQVARLGPVGDDLVLFLLPHQASEGDVFGFLVADSTGFLAGGERPGAYLLFLVGRLAYLIGFPWLLGWTALVGVASASAFTLYLTEVRPQADYRITAGLLLLSWPIAVPVGFWPPSMHFNAAACASFLAAWIGLKSARWRPAALFLHLLAITTLEIYLLAAPLLVALGWLASRLGLVSADEGRAARIRTSLSQMMAVSAVYAVWRFAVVPRILAARLSYESQLDSVAGIWDRIRSGLPEMLWPWTSAASVGTDVEVPTVYWLGCAALAIAMLARFSIGSAGSPSLRTGPRGWSIGLIPGSVLLLHWTLIVALAPGGLQDTTGLASRLNHPLIPALAMTVAALLVPSGLPYDGARSRLWRAFCAATVVLVVGAGAAIVWRVKDVHASYWDDSVRLVGDLRRVCPGLAADSVVLVDGRSPHSLVRMGGVGMSFYELSSFLVASYDDPTLRGVRPDETQLVGKGVRPLVWGEAGGWNRIVDHGYLYARPVEVVEPFERSRLLTFSYLSGRGLRMEDSLVHSFRSGRARRIWNGPERCLATSDAPVSPALCHVSPNLCTATR